MFVVNVREGVVVALHLPIGCLVHVLYVLCHILYIDEYHIEQTKSCVISKEM